MLQQLYLNLPALEWVADREVLPSHLVIWKAIKVQRFDVLEWCFKVYGNSKDMVLKDLIGMILSFGSNYPSYQNASENTRLWLLRVIPEDMRTDELLARIKDRYLDKDATWIKGSESHQHLIQDLVQMHI